MYTVGQTGGEAEHTLTTDEMPSHYHTLMGNYYRAPLMFEENIYTIRVKAAPNDGNYNVPGVDYGSGSWSQTRSTAPTGGVDQPHNNMPPYITYYCFERIA